ncbi:hypothetical protein ACSBR2_007651 [Camellia fascicularis]
MENTKQVSGGGSYSSSSSFTSDLFGPKDPSSSSSSSTNIFGSVFGPPSTGLGKDSSHTGFMGSMKMNDFASQYGIAKHGTPDNMSQRGKGEASVEPCYFSSSIYYGGQEVYPSTTHTTVSQHIGHSITKFCLRVMPSPNPQRKRVGDKLYNYLHCV